MEPILRWVRKGYADDWLVVAQEDYGRYILPIPVNIVLHARINQPSLPT